MEKPPFVLSIMNIKRKPRRAFSVSSG